MATATLTKEPKAAAAATKAESVEAISSNEAQSATWAETNGHAPGHAETNGHLTKADEYRREISSDLAYARRELREAQREVQDLTGDLKEAKDRMKAAQIRVNSLCESVIDIETGNYTPAMFDSNGDAKGKDAADAPHDAGAAMPIATLAEYGLTEKQCEMLAESKLEIKTVGDLETAMRENEWWHRDVKGLGESKIDRVSDALSEFRLAYPVPVAENESEVELIVDGKSAGTMTGEAAATRILKDATEKLKA